MKAKLILSALLLSAFGLSASAQDSNPVTNDDGSVTYRLACVGDTWVRSGSNNENTPHGSDKNLQLKLSAGISGLMGFEKLVLPENKVIKDATLHVITFVNSGGTNTIYPFVDFDESTANYATFASQIENLSEPSVNFSCVGEGNQDINKEGYTRTNLDKWTNDIDVTTIVKYLYSTSNSNLNFIIQNVSDKDTRLVAKETDITMTFTDGTTVQPSDLVPYLTITVEDKLELDTSEVKFDCVADSWIRENNTTWNGGANTPTLEANKGLFSILYGFNYVVPEGMYVESATLRFVTARSKNGGPLDLYGYPNDFVETTTWGDEAKYIEKLTNKDILYNFVPKAQNDKDLAIDVIDPEYQSLEAWTNEFDVTDYLNSLPTYVSRANFFISNANSQKCFYSKDNKGTKAFPEDPIGSLSAEEQAAYEKFGAEFTAEDLMPYLLVKFVKKETLVGDEGLNFQSDFNTDGPVATGTHKSNNTVHISTSKANFDYTQVYVQVDKKDAVKAVASRKVAANTNESDYHSAEITENGIDVTLNKVGNYSITVSPVQGSKYAFEPVSLDADISPLEVTVGTATEDTNKSWNKEGSYKTVGVSFDNPNGSSYTDFFNVDIKPAWEDSEVVEDAKTEFKPEWLYNQMVAILDAKGVVDGYLTADPEVDLQDNTDLVVTTSCSGAYNVTFKSTDEDVVFVNNNNSTSQELTVTINIAPSFTQQYSYSIKDKVYTNDGLNISGAQVDVDGGKAVLSQAEFDNAVLYVPGVYFVTIRYEVSPAAGTRDVAENQTIQNGGTMDLTDASTLTLTMTKNGVTTEPLTITLTEGTPTAVEGIEAAEGEARYFNLQGVEVMNPDHGIFIKVQNGKASKVIM